MHYQALTTGVKRKKEENRVERNGLEFVGGCNNSCKRSRGVGVYFEYVLLLIRGVGEANFTSGNVILHPTVPVGPVNAFPCSP